MARTKMHRREQDGEFIAIGTGVFYIKDAGIWREMTKVEMDLIRGQINAPGTANLPMQINGMLPDPASGEDGDYYVLLYPVGWDGPVWQDPSLTP
ncbi:MAG: hypothetical protein OXF79_08415 [Chloroflexi bacterium]|nr:hypothetical protein [Chloroflexota bacterium]